MIEKRQLGSTLMEVSRIGISSSFGAETEVYEEAFERGCNYYTWGTFIRGRSSSFRKFIRQVNQKGKREELFLSLLSYSHSSFLGNTFFKSALRRLNTEYIDGLILGYYPKRPPERVLDWAQSLKEKGLVRAIGLTTHNRDIITPLAKEGIIDYFHFRYNAVHRGAEEEVFPLLQHYSPGLISFTATCWGKLFQQKKMPEGVEVPTAGDCYRFVLAREEVDVCMMGVKNKEMLDANFKELEKGPLTAEELMWMKKIGKHIYGRKR